MFDARPKMFKSSFFSYNREEERVDYNEKRNTTIISFFVLCNNNFLAKYGEYRGICFAWAVFGKPYPLNKGLSIMLTLPFAPCTRPLSSKINIAKKLETLEKSYS